MSVDRARENRRKAMKNALKAMAWAIPVSYSIFQTPLKKKKRSAHICTQEPLAIDDQHRLQNGLLKRRYRGLLVGTGGVRLRSRGWRSAHVLVFRTRHQQRRDSQCQE